MKDDDSFPLIVPIIFAIATCVFCIWMIVELNKLDLLNILSLVVLLAPIAIDIEAFLFYIGGKL